MYGTHLRNKKKLSKTGVSRLETTIGLSMTETITKIASILTIIIYIKVVKIKASFLTFMAGNIWKHNVFFDYCLSKLPDLSFF